MNAKSYVLSPVKFKTFVLESSEPKVKALPTWKRGSSFGQHTSDVTKKIHINQTCFSDPEKGFFWVNTLPNGFFSNEPYTQGTTCSRGKGKKVPRGQ